MYEINCDLIINSSLKKVDLNVKRNQKAVDKEQKQKGNSGGRGGGHQVAVISQELIDN